MRRYSALSVDVALMMAATLLALLLRENLAISDTKLLETLPYFVATLIAALIVFPASALHRVIWRFSGPQHHSRVIFAVLAVSSGAAGISFAYNRLEGVARSLPLLQALVGIVVLVGVRMLHRASHAEHRRRKASAALFQVSEGPAAESVLIVGVGWLTETYLQALAELAPTRLSIAGLIGQSDRHFGRLASSYPVLGCPEDIEAIVDDLEVKGISLSRIIVTAAFHSLSPAAKAALLRIERASAIAVQFLAEELGLDAERKVRNSSTSQAMSSEPCLAMPKEELETLACRPYWMVKRAADTSMALALLIVTLPLTAMIAVLVAVNVGFPVLFWQQRPGLGGRPFRLYKFRTMGAAHSLDGHRLEDGERLSKLGAFLRRTRLDELPQLFNIMRGDMSFVGPRPLLARDEANTYRDRLLVRPGLTGWAQVVGGREISAADKAALDVWYVKNASVGLDLRIMARTLPLLIFGEQISKPLIRRTWQDLRRAAALEAGASPLL